MTCESSRTVGRKQTPARAEARPFRAESSHTGVALTLVQNLFSEDARSGLANTMIRPRVAQVASPPGQTPPSDLRSPRS
jgi:hypothetical protein